MSSKRPRQSVNKRHIEAHGTGRSNSRVQKSGLQTNSSGDNNSSLNRQKNNARMMLGFDQLWQILKMDADSAVLEMNRISSQLQKLILGPDIPSDVLTLLIQVIGDKICSEDINLKVMRNSLLAKICVPEFLTNLKENTYSLMHDEHDTDSKRSAVANDVDGLDKSPEKVLSHMLSFYSVFMQTMPTSARELLSKNLKATKLALKSLKNVAATDIMKDSYLKLETRFLKLENCSQETTTPGSLDKNKDFQTRPTSKSAFTKADVERLYMEEPPQDFRTLSVAPTKEELRSEEQPYLRPCIEKGNYLSTDVYLDVQFRLLREDFVAPLREGIQYYLEQQRQTGRQKKRMPFGTVRIYNGVQIVNVKLNGDMTVYTLQFLKDSFKNIKWDKSKRLLTGSLLCLTADKFQSLYLATVVFRRPEDLKQGMIDVVWEGNKPEIGQKSYLMMESEVYYEAYRHTLSSLQKIELDKYPMKKYIVDANNGEIPEPSYLSPQEMDQFCESMLNFVSFNESRQNKTQSTVEMAHTSKSFPKSEAVSVRTIVEEDIVSNRAEINNSSEINKVVEDPLDLNSWPTADELGMDDSQYVAFQSAVTKELCVIQGPPGTGKTYIGLQIAKLFLSNPQIYEMGHPILIVCYTNHALDQFLEGIIDIMEKLEICSKDNLIRIGSRSNSEKLKDYSIQARMQEARKLRKFERNYAILRNKKRIKLQDLQNERDYLLDELKILSSLKGVVDLDTLSVANELKKKCPRLNATLFGKTIQTGRYKFSKQIKIYDWLGFNEWDFNKRHFVANRQIRKWFEMSTRVSIVSNDSIIINVPDEAYPAMVEEGEVIEEDYDMNEIMQHRMEIFMEMETTRKRPWKKEMELKYVIATEFVDQQFQNDSSLVAKQQFLRRLLADFYDGKLQLTEISQEFLENVEEKQYFSIDDRWAIYFHFVEAARNIILTDIQRLETKIIETQKQLQEVNILGESQLLNQAMFVGLTTTGAAKYNKVLRMMKSPIVIVEEAAEVMESHIVTSLTEYCGHLILIGDHKQLRPNPNVYKLAKDYNLDVSLFERLINNNISSCQLKIQHRMRPNICKLLVPTIYENLENHPSVLEYPRIFGTTKTLYFIDHEELETCDDDDATKSNPHEASFLVKLCRYLILQGYSASQITILTTYKGQMFLLKKLNTQDSQISAGVRITVVDNFQGEENDIILLSLVRSNSKNNIGYLRTDNRICVALSRAKHGLFVIGNMNGMVSSSSTWTKIREDLEKENNIGSQLELKCEVHGVVTLVKNKDDFQKVPEGGCLRVCEKVLLCEHNCQMVCHSYDRDHKEYKCKFPCKRMCPNDHPCRKPCYIECGKCTVKMDKLLPCKHTINMECHISVRDFKCETRVEKKLPCGHKKLLKCNIDPKKYDCYENVIKVLPCGHSLTSNCYIKVKSIKCKILTPQIMPKCGHEVMVHCYMKEDNKLWKCQKPCDIQLDCGHTCGQKCHFEINRDHVGHICTKPCGRVCYSGHTCQANHKCCHPCPKCEVVVDRVLPCSHVTQIECHIDTNSVFCGQICRRKLDCGHECQKRCSDACLCEMKVKKMSIDCSHELSLKCHQHPSREFCQTLVPGNSVSPCGHAVMIPCTIENTATPQDCLMHCKHPCDEIITEGNCGHKCSGNCFSCFQGRIHKRCTEKCERNLPCGHSCKFPCAALCPPCQKPCNNKCEHSKCNRECGFPCSGCNEPCNWECSHEKCTRRCREKCDRKPCNFPCTIPKKCGHLCIGLCGEACPPQCKICNAEEVVEILFGNEDDPDARFIYLEDCKHIIEVEAMDKHMTTTVVENGISVKKCPKCNSVIQNCKRYGDILRKGKDDILEIKAKIHGLCQGIQVKMEKMTKYFQNYKKHDSLQDFREFLQKYFVFSNKRHWNGNLIFLKRIDQYLFESLDNMVMWWRNASDDLDIAIKFNAGDQLQLTLRYQAFFAEVMKRLLPLSQREIMDFDRELQKISARQKLYRRAAIDNFYSLSVANEKYATIFKFLEDLELKPFTSKIKEQFLNYLADLDSVIIHDVKLWREEERSRKEIFQAVGFGAHHWYRCPKGHLYVIGDCGQPNQTAICPECKENIGASGYHQLAPGNTHASADMSESNIPGPDIEFLENNSG